MTRYQLQTMGKGDTMNKTMYKKEREKWKQHLKAWV